MNIKIGKRYMSINLISKDIRLHWKNKKFLYNSYSEITELNYYWRWILILRRIMIYIGYYK